MIRKVLVANRGEIAVRVLRAATELGIRTVAMYSHEDRASFHRVKADESYPIGEPGRPVRAYLDIEATIALAKRAKVDAIHPGYGFMSESPALAEACEQAGITFVGPSVEVLRATGDKTRARDAAVAAGLPVLEASEAIVDAADAVAEAERIGYPIFIKAAAGGGGRGLRRIDDPDELEGAVESAIREAEAAFGDGTVFLEKAVTRPRHIEVQILGDATGEVLHLFERDCSVQRRHQKVVEIAPAPNLDDDLRQRLLADAVALGRAVGYVNAGTVEFLVGENGEHVFIEVNPRVQVEHTVTEEITGIDIVQTQLMVAGGASFEELGLRQEDVVPRGTAIQCRITTEDPSNGFRPDLGRISAFRDVGGAGIRIDSASIEVGMEIQPFFDPLLIKLTARGPDLVAAARRARRAVTEFRVRGVRTNANFLSAVLADDDFLAGRATTAFIDEHPDLLITAPGGDRTSRLLDFVGDVTVNRPHGHTPSSLDPRVKLPELDSADEPVPGSRQLLDDIGPDAFARQLREQTALAVTDTTFRDAHQSLLATRVRTGDLVAAAPVIAHHLGGLFSVEAWGGATHDTAIRFLREDPWVRLEQLREAMPNVCLQMLLRGQNTVGYGTYPTSVVEAYVAEAADAGIDIFRVFDALNEVSRMEPAIRAVVDVGKIAEGTLCYTSDLLDPNEKTYTLDHYLAVAEGVINAGAQILCIKDMAGLLRPPAAHLLIAALRERFDAPVHLHTHDTAGGQLATYLAASEAGVDAVDTAAAPMSGGTSQPSMAALVAATDHSERATGLDLDRIIDFEPYWEAVRRLYAPFEAGLAAPTGSVYRHEIPGGQLSNLRQQAIALNLGDRFEEVEALYTRCNALLGRPIKVTPTSKVVGDLALYLASSGLDPDELAEDPGAHDLPQSVVEYLAGGLGNPPGGWPEPFRTKVLEAHGPVDIDNTADPEAVDAVGQAEPGAQRRRALDRVLFPKPTSELEASELAYGDVSVLPTRTFFYGLEPDEEIVADLEPGVRLYIELEAITEPDQRGRRTVYMRVNGQTRFIEALDREVGDPTPEAESADASNPGHVAATVTGVVTVAVSAGDEVTQGQRIATIEAMKMESPVRAPIAGEVARVVTPSGSSIEPGDLMIEITPSGDASDDADGNGDE
ncbi:MAG: pyruvate carboxylase [Nitriliruptoraceae bacterium]